MVDNILKSLENMVNMAKEDSGAYETIINRIRESFDGKKIKIIPNTVNAYLLGCMYDQDFTGPLGCSPKCINGLAPMDGSVDVTPCNDMVIIYDDGHLQIKNSENSGHAWIYVGPQFTGFNENDLMILRTHGVKTASMIYGTEDGKYRNIQDPVPVNNLPTVRAVPSDVPLTPNSMSNGAANWWWIVLIIVIIIVIIIVGYFWIDRRRRAARVSGYGAVGVAGTKGQWPSSSGQWPSSSGQWTDSKKDNYMLKTPNGKIYTLTEDFQ
jgi:hypothetical protein